MSSPSKTREMGVMKLMMSDYTVETINDGLNEFNVVELHGPKESLYEDPSLTLTKSFWRRENWIYATPKATEWSHSTLLVFLKEKSLIDLDIQPEFKDGVTAWTRLKDGANLKSMKGDLVVKL
ncbi:hypothetical protein K1719_009437 [Acacia pycnantha]|nr:hypothetical protein K1719_009437 [Acacia pycnantha]